jgi:hypothetical protein
MTNYYVSTHSDIACVVGNTGKSITIIAGSTAAYTSSSGSLGLTVTVVGTGVGFSYSWVGVSRAILKTWNWSYECYCTTP